MLATAESALNVADYYACSDREGDRQGATTNALCAIACILLAQEKRIAKESEPNE